MSVELGLGDPHSEFKVYIANRPNYAGYNELTCVHTLEIGQVNAIGQACGNGWRKVFNVYAKLLFALKLTEVVDTTSFCSWQDYRDKKLLQANSNTSLLFSKPNLNELGWHIVMGKTHAHELGLSSSVAWLDKEFAVDRNTRLIVCPYFDYRQLSNIKIIRLVQLIHSLNSQ